MLVLSRKPGQHIKVLWQGVEITVRVLSVVGNRVRLGIAAPASVSVLREEVAQRGTPPVGELPESGSAATS